MGGVILEFSADKYYNAGRAEERADLLSALVKDGFLPAAEAAKRLNMTEREFLKLSGQYIAH